jgi:hypothetical protein
MTDAEIKSYYSSLLIMQYSEQPNAVATVQAFVNMLVANQLPATLEDAFTIDTAVGVQLDVLGKYVGADRYGYNFSGAMTLTDAQFREYIKLRVAQTVYGSSLADIQDFLAISFPGVLFIYDHTTMRITYLFADAIGAQQLVEFFIKEGALPRPMGVRMTVIYRNNVQFFGMPSYGEVANYPTWNATTTYSTNQAVKYSGVYYQSLVDNNLNNTPVVGANWKLYQGYNIEPFSNYGFSTWPSWPWVSYANALAT